MRSLSLSALGLCCAVTAYFFWPEPADAVTTVPHGQNQVESAPPRQPPPRDFKAAGVQAKWVTDLTRAGSRLRLPDGSSVPILNGAYGAPPPRWPRRIPWSPITGKMVDPDGYEWYMHKDGSRTITQMVYSYQDGRQIAATNVFNFHKGSLAIDPKFLETRERENGGKR